MARVPSARREGCGRRSCGRRAARVDRARPDRVVDVLRGGLGALPAGVGGGRGDGRNRRARGVRRRARRRVHVARSAGDRFAAGARAGRSRTCLRDDPYAYAGSRSLDGGCVVRARRRPSDLRALRPHPIRRLPRRASCLDARGPALGRACTRRASSSRSVVRSVALPDSARYAIGFARCGREGARPGSVPRSARRLVVQQLSPRAGALRPDRCGGDRRIAARATCRARGTPALGGLRRRRDARRARADARVSVVRALLRRRVAVAGAALRGLPAIRIRFRGRARCARGSCRPLRRPSRACRRDHAAAALPRRLRRWAWQRAARLADVGRSGGRGACACRWLLENGTAGGAGRLCGGGLPPTGRDSRHRPLVTGANGLGIRVDAGARPRAPHGYPWR